MNTPTDKALDGLVAMLHELTGHNWQRRNAWDVAVTSAIVAAMKGAVLAAAQDNPWQAHERRMTEYNRRIVTEEDLAAQVVAEYEAK